MGSWTPRPTPARSRRGGRRARTRTSACRPRACSSSTSTGRTTPGPAIRPGEDLGECPVSLTPRGGRHYIFRQPAGKSLEEHGRAGSRRRSTPGPTAATSSCRPRWWTASRTGGPRRSRRRPGRSARAAGVARGPAWTAERTCSPRAQPARGGRPDGGPRRARGAPGRDPAAGGNVIPAGHRNATLARLGGAMRRVGMSQEEILAALARANQDRCRPPLPDREVERIAASICPLRARPGRRRGGGEPLGAGQPSRPPQPTRARTGDPRSRPDSRRAPAHPRLRLRGHGPLPGDGPVPEPRDGVSPGALALQAVLAGRKVRDPGDNRTNLYLLGLAHSVGRARTGRASSTPRSCTRSACRARSAGGSPPGEGIQDALFTEPCMLFQTDEIDGMLQSINKAKDARHESIMGTLLTMYSSANSVFPMRRKAGKRRARRHRPALPGDLRHGDPEPLLRGALGADADQRVLRPHDHPRVRQALARAGAADPAAARARAGDGPVVGGLPARHRQPRELASRAPDRAADG